MKSLKLILIMFVMMFAAVSFAAAGEPVFSDTGALNYGNPDNWVVNEKDGGKAVDLFFVYPTYVMGAEHSLFTTIDEMKKAPVWFSVKCQASAFAPYTNTFMPWYRQTTMYLAECCDRDNQVYLDVLYRNLSYQDIEASLDYYFENYNNGKPFIIAGHSQGSAMVLDVLMHYMQEHPDYLERMVAAYSIGFAPSEKMFVDYPSLKFAEGETDTGVVISWTTEGLFASGDSILMPENPLVINPLNWKRDGSYASAYYNKGCLSNETGEIVNGYADAQINLKRGTLICTKAKQWTEDDAFSTQSLHESDYSLYFCNIRENCAKRIASYFYSQRAGKL